jgi:hypothetical protein
MRARGFGDEYIDRYRMMNTFQQQKRPLIILICGSACSGKSTLAQQLASRLNLPNVLQIDAFRDLLQGGNDAPLLETPLYMRHDLDSEALIEAYKEECKVMRRALDGDLVKCICDGKSIIIEGLHLDPGLYTSEFGKGGLLERRASQQLVEETALVEQDGEEGEEEKKKQPPLACRIKSIDEGLRTYGGPVFVPIVLRIEPEEYPTMAEEWLKRQLPAQYGVEAATAEREKTLEQLIMLQGYLSSYSDLGVPVMTTGVLKFQDTLNSLHDHVLGCIQQSFSGDEEI